MDEGFQERKWLQLKIIFMTLAYSVAPSPVSFPRPTAWDVFEDTSQPQTQPLPLSSPAKKM